MFQVNDNTKHYNSYEDWNDPSDHSLYFPEDYGQSSSDNEDSVVLIPESLEEFVVETEEFDLFDTLVFPTQQESISELHSLPLEAPLVGGGKKRTQKKKQRSPQKNNKIGQAHHISAQLRPSDIMPPYKNVILNYNDPDCQMADSTSQFVIKSMKMNSLYDVDPFILSSSVAGFQQLMTFYEFFRVNNCSIKWCVANNEAFELNVGIKFSNRRLDTSVTTRQGAIDELENGLSTRPIALQRSTGGSSVKTITQALDCASLLANPKLYEGSENYVGTALVDPTDLLWVNMIIYGPTTALNLTNGTLAALSLRYRARLFARTSIQDPLLAQLKRATKEQLIAELSKRSSDYVDRTVVSEDQRLLYLQERHNKLRQSRVSVTGGT